MYTPRDHTFLEKALYKPTIIINMVINIIISIPVSVVTGCGLKH